MTVVLSVDFVRSTIEGSRVLIRRHLSRGSKINTPPLSGSGEAVKSHINGWWSGRMHFSTKLFPASHAICRFLCASCLSIGSPGAVMPPSRWVTRRVAIVTQRKCACWLSSRIAAQFKSTDTALSNRPLLYNSTRWKWVHDLSKFII